MFYSLMISISLLTREVYILQWIFQANKWRGQLSKPQSFSTNLQNQSMKHDITSIHTNTAAYPINKRKLLRRRQNIIAKSWKTFLKNIYCEANIIETRNIVTSISFLSMHMLGMWYISVTKIKISWDRLLILWNYRNISLKWKSASLLQDVLVSFLKSKYTNVLKCKLK